MREKKKDGGMPAAETLTVCSERVLQHFLPISLSAQDSRSNKLQASDKRHSSKESSMAAARPASSSWPCTRRLTYLLNHVNSRSFFLLWARHLWYARKNLGWSSTNVLYLEIKIKVCGVLMTDERLLSPTGNTEEENNALMLPRITE